MGKIACNCTIGQKAIIVREDKILILKRSSDNEVDYAHETWDFTGGKVNPDESLLESLIREVSEETTLKISSILKVLSMRAFWVDNETRKVHRTILLCLADGEVRLSGEHTDFRWIDPENISKYTFADEIDIQDVLQRLPSVLSKSTELNDTKIW